MSTRKKKNNTPKRSAPHQSAIIENDDNRASVLAEVVNRVLAAFKNGQEIRLVSIKQTVCSDMKYTGRVPKTVEILAAIPQKYSFLQELLKAKPVRSASGIAVVAVMCKPHRCPHITLTGNICVYCVSSLFFPLFPPPPSLSLLAPHSFSQLSLVVLTLTLSTLLSLILVMSPLQ